MRYEQAQKEIAKIMKSMVGRYRLYNIFRDFIVLAACSISNSVDPSQWKNREKMYMDTISKYDKKESEKFAEMLALTVLAYESRMGDFIGELYMSMEFGNKDAGQFFTPYNLSRMMAGFLDVKPDENGIVTLNEPAVGSGGMVVAYAEKMKLADLNYQKQLRVVCNDIDYDVVKMCYIQLSLLGIDAIVMQGNTLAPLDNPPGEIWFTPMHIMNLAREQQREKTEKMVSGMQKVLSLEKHEPIEEPVQLTLF